MSYDPFGDDPDADIFRDDNDEVLEEAQTTSDIESGTAHKHTVDGTECPTCGIIHDDFLSEDLPAEAVEAILTFFDAMPDEFVMSILEGRGTGKKTKPQADILTTFIGYTERMDSTNEIGPLMLAIVEHLDEQTGGKISAKWHIYEAERRLIISHKVFKSANTALDDATTNEADASYISLLGLTLDFAKERLKICKENYLKVATAINYEPTESILEHGLRPDNQERDTQEEIANELHKQLLVK